MVLLISGDGLAGMRQRDLIQWYVNHQNEKNNYSSMEEAAAEITKIKAIIEVHIHFIYHSQNLFINMQTNVVYLTKIKTFVQCRV